MSDEDLDRRHFLRTGGLVAGTAAGFALASAGRAEAAATYQAYRPVPTPFRWIDSRAFNVPISAGQRLRILPPGGGWGSPVPLAVCVNLTVTQGSADGWLALFPGNVNWGGTSNINWVAGWTIANNAYVGLDPSDGAVRLQMGGNGSVHYILDVLATLVTVDTVGESLSSPAPSGPGRVVVD